MIAPTVASRKRSFSRLRSLDFGSTSSGQEEVQTDPEPYGDMKDTCNASQRSSTAASSQTKAKPKPLERSYRKVPFAERVNCALTPNDPDFIVLEQYFERLLRNRNLTMTDILEDHFTPREIEQFIPASKGPVAEEQEHNTVEFLRIMNSTFKGKLQTLSCKMTMLFLGFPVEPMKVGPVQGATQFDLEPRRDSQVAAEDPFVFLDDYTPHIGGATASLRTEMLTTGLRGGNLEEDDTKLILSDIDEVSSMRWDREANEQLTMSLRGGALAYDELPDHSTAAAGAAAGSFLQLYGRQGYVGIGPKWSHFIEGVVWLLSSDLVVDDPNATVYVALDLFEGGLLNKTYLQTYEGALYPNAAKYDENTGDELLAFVTANMNKSHDLQPSVKQRVCFVRFSRDQRPHTFRPLDAVTGLVEVSLTGFQQNPTVYMRTTTAPSERNCPSQYATEFHRAMNTLLPPMERHKFISLRLQRDGSPGEDCGRIYVGQDPPQTLIDLIPQYIATRNRFQLTATLNYVPVEDIPILTSIRRDGTTELPGLAGRIKKHELPDMNQIADMIVDYMVAGRQSKEAVDYVELYLPVQGFVDESIEPVLCCYENGQPSSTDHIWTDRINEFKAEERGAMFDAGFGIWGRPVFSQYTLVNDLDKTEPTECVLDNLLDLDVASFRLAVSTFLFPQRYDGHDRNHALFLATGKEGGQAEHVIRFDTTDQEWVYIKRRISFSVIRVTITTKDNKYDLEVATRWEVDPSSYWGPCYDELEKIVRAQHTAERSTRVGAVSLSSSVDQAGDLVRTRPDKQSPTAMRLQTAWKAPSIFANPFRPMVPINAPAIEPLLRVGQHLPTVTLAQRTPTETAQLENELHSIRYLLLGRIRECPFAGCGRSFQHRDRDALDAHIKHDHAILRCPYCHVTERKGPGSEGQLYFRDKELALQHFYDNHFLELMSQARAGAHGIGLVDNGVPNVVLNNAGRRDTAASYKHCDQCGRDHHACHDPKDRQNHKEKCLNLNPANLRPGEVRDFPQYCEYCGAASDGSCANRTCPAKQSSSSNPAPAICCINCGLTWAGYDTAYILRHRSGCRPLGGKSWDYCGFCGIPYADLDPLSKAGHGQVCSKRPVALPLQCTECPKMLTTPGGVRDHLRSEHKIREECPWCDQRFPNHDRTWTYEVKAHHFAGHMGAHPQINGVGTGTKVGLDDLKCPGYVDCGVIVSQMSSEQYADHMFHNHAVAMQSGKRWHPNGLNMIIRDTSTSRAWPTKTRDLVTKAPAEIHGGDEWENWNPKFEWKFAAAPRAPSPDWDDAGPARRRGGAKFVPGEDMRCSRCFTPAPLRGHRNREYEISLHSTDRYSCQIRRAPGEYNTAPGHFPNRSGWVKFPKGFNFKAARRNFLGAYPAYEGTIFPVDDDRVDAVYDDPNQIRGQQTDDIFSGVIHSTKRRAQHQLPWPPHPGPGSYRNTDGRDSTWHTVPDKSDVPTTSASRRGARSGALASPSDAPAGAAGVATGKALIRPFKAARGNGIAPGSSGRVEEDSGSSGHSAEDSVTSPNEDEDVDMQDVVYDSQRPFARRGLIGYDVHYRDFDRDDEPEEEHDDRIGQKDGAYEDFSVLKPGMKALPADFRSPLEAGFPSRKRSRTPRTEAANLDEGDERRTKRMKGFGSTSKKVTSLAANDSEAIGASAASRPKTRGGRSHTAMPAVQDESKLEDKKSTAKPKATPRPETKMVAKPAPNFEVSSAAELVAPSIEHVTEPPSTTTRKSSRTIKSGKKVSYVDEGAADDTGEDAAAAELVALNKSTKTPKPGRRKADDNDSVTEEAKAIKTPAKTSAKSVAKTPGKTPAKRGRKKAEADEHESDAPIESVPEPEIDGGMAKRQPRFR